jgi:hypothetical protein
MTTLRVYVSAACASCAIAYQRVAQVRHLRPHQPIEVIDLDYVRAERPLVVFGTPTYCLDDQIISLGNPSLPALLAELDGATAPPGDISQLAGDVPPGRG